MSSQRRVMNLCGFLSLLIFLAVVLSPVSGETPTNATGTSFEYKVQNDPFFIVAYPQGMTLHITSAYSRNSYHLENDQNVRYDFSSRENNEWAPLDEKALTAYEKLLMDPVTGPNSSRNITTGKTTLNADANVSTYFSQYLDTKNDELIYALVMSTNQSIISGILIEPKAMYKTPYGEFTRKTLLTLSPRNMDKALVFTLAGNDKTLGEKSNTTAPQKSTDKAIAYDPYSGLYYDTNSGYYYLPYYGVFYDPKTGNYYYPNQFGDYGTNYFPDYTGYYDQAGLNTGGYYDGLYGGYGGNTGGYDPTDLIQSVVDYRQAAMDASNDAWDAYIRE